MLMSRYCYVGVCRKLDVTIEREKERETEEGTNAKMVYGYGYGYGYTKRCKEGIWTRRMWRSERKEKKSLKKVLKKCGTTQTFYTNGPQIFFPSHSNTNTSTCTRQDNKQQQTQTACTMRGNVDIRGHKQNLDSKVLIAIIITIT